MLLKAINKPFISCYRSFCPFNGQVLVYIFLGKVTDCNAMYSYYDNEATSDIHKCLYCFFML